MAILTCYEPFTTLLTMVQTYRKRLSN